MAIAVLVASILILTGSLVVTFRRQPQQIQQPQLPILPPSQEKVEYIYNIENLTNLLSQIEKNTRWRGRE